MIKRPIVPRRLRKALPNGFGWIDHRLLRSGQLALPGAQALGLYCLLVCASDHQGLSYYSQERLCSLLCIDAQALQAARHALCQAALIAYARPLYQVLALDSEESCPLPRPASARHTRPAPAPLQLPPGVSLRAMIESSLSEGGVR